MQIYYLMLRKEPNRMLFQYVCETEIRETVHLSKALQFFFQKNDLYLSFLFLIFLLSLMLVFKSMLLIRDILLYNLHPCCAQLVYLHNQSLIIL